MFATFVFSIIAAGLILIAGRKDAARDPRLTFFLLMLMAAVPVLSAYAPKFGVLPDSVTSGVPWLNWLSAIWLIGSGWCMVRLAMASRALDQLCKSAHRLGQIDGVEIFTCAALQSPLAAGVFRQKILVPESWPSWSQKDQRMVLRHELSHHRRRDPLWIFAAEIIRAFLWWHPLVHWMIARFRLQCEYACDESVLRAGIDAKVYALRLCEMAEVRKNSPLTLAMASPSSLRLRVTHMLQPSVKMTALALFTLMLIGMICAGGLSVLGAKHLRIGQDEVNLRLSAEPFPGEL